MNRTALLLVSLFAASAHASGTRTFEQSSREDFSKGEARGTMVLPTGEVVAGMTTKRTAIDAAFAWCAALSPDGKTAYFGTGDEGKIFSMSTGAAGEY